MAPDLCVSPTNEYDRLRDNSIASNQARLQPLGILPVAQELFPKPVAASQPFRRPTKRQTVPAGSQRLSSRLAVVSRHSYCEVSPAKARRAGLLHRVRTGGMSTVTQTAKPHQTDEVDVRVRSAAFLGIQPDGKGWSHPNVRTFSWNYHG